MVSVCVYVYEIPLLVNVILVAGRSEPCSRGPQQ